LVDELSLCGTVVTESEACRLDIAIDLTIPLPHRVKIEVQIDVDICRGIVYVSGISLLTSKVDLPLILRGKVKPMLWGWLIPIINTTFIELCTTAYLFTLGLHISSQNSTSCLCLARAPKSYHLQRPSSK
jgi:hypothetical protein